MPKRKREQKPKKRVQAGTVNIRKPTPKTHKRQKRIESDSEESHAPESSRKVESVKNKESETSGFNDPQSVSSANIIRSANESVSSQRSHSTISLRSREIPKPLNI